ncbi:VOC family protein [Leucobacter viscericola]|uniref:VOC family protein n=1 Tax=Leucobacter viscericola TaxID=2714935 RepID=A0A6G7XCW9_9MICO|nr:VOC family protein [Leucobacter viscericola]QIK62289.1 VOC family protein [Leucobacter viscericola]
MISLGMITLDTESPRTLAAWWAERLGGEIVMDADGWFCVVNTPNIPVALGFQKVEEPTPGKNRLHLDLNRSADSNREELVSEWVAAGATHLGQRGEAGFSWDTFTDPGGNEFCIGDPH